MPDLNYLAQLIQARSGIVVGPGKRYLLEARLAPLLRREGMTDLTELATRLAQGDRSGLAQEVMEAFATHETLFFRDAKPFEHLRATGLPGLASRRPPGSRLRLWSAAASTGQEAYSLAITLAEYGLADRTRVEVIGTDLSREAIGRARAGLYSHYEVQRGLSIFRLVEHFTAEGREWRINPGARALCSFREWNLLDDPTPLGRFDVVFCRNVLLYLSPEARIRVLTFIRRQFAPDDLVYLGASETLLDLDEMQERDGPCYAGASLWRDSDLGGASNQAMAPRAATGQTHSTRPARTPTYQS